MTKLIYGLKLTEDQQSQLSTEHTIFLHGNIFGIIGQQVPTGDEHPMYSMLKSCEMDEVHHLLSSYNFAGQPEWWVQDT